MDKSIRYLSGVGEKRFEYFKKLGAQTVDELIHILPRRYEDMGNIVDIADLGAHRGEKVSICATISLPVTETRISGGTLTTVFADDDTGRTRIVYFNNRFIKNMLRQGQTKLFYGKIPENGAPSMSNPEFLESLPDTRLLMPVYPLVSGLSQKLMRKTMSSALEIAGLSDALPAEIIKKYRLCDFAAAMRGIHTPETWQEVNHARRRLIFEELLYFSLGLRMMKSRVKAPSAVIVSDFPDDYLKLHDFEPTGAQKNALAEIYADLSGKTAMNRLLQGDVGSGKTLVAGQCARCVIKSGAQAAMMVPTEVLAGQHYRYFEPLFSKLGIKTALLTASVPATEKKKIKTALKSGDIDFVIATHAVLQGDVGFKNLGLIITDEQHRFGVMQRSLLAEKGKGVHTLVMSATPIPRTLALMMWGDLELSVIDSLPSGRQTVKTYLVDSGYSDRLHAFIGKQIERGGRAYVVCPMIEDSEESDLASANGRYDGLCRIFGREKVGLIHGKMKPALKDKAMRDFAEGRILVLVSTTVIEVGVNVPEATLMIIENAERFGLSQLHQLRGRVGRGKMQSFCVLVSDTTSETAITRLDFFEKNTDGFAIARKDLELRGPGNFFGSDQHGLPQMRIADMQNDMNTLNEAVACAAALLEKDGRLSGYPLIKNNVFSLFESKGEIFN